jgi:hypothetical protein
VCLLQSRVDNTVLELTATGESVRDLREKSVMPLEQAVSDIRDQVCVCGRWWGGLSGKARLYLESSRLHASKAG